MRELIDSLFAGSEHYELYLGVIETVEGIIREFPEDAWKRKMIGDPELERQAQAKADTEAARLLLYHGTRLLDEGGDAGMYSNMAKLQSANAATRACDAAIQSHGGSGMDEDTGILALWRTARVLKIAPINNEMILNYIAQHGMGLPRSY